MKRAFMRFASLLLVLSVVLSGCGKSESAQTEPTTQPSEPPAVEQEAVACTNLSTADGIISKEFTSIHESWLVTLTWGPANTTDALRVQYDNTILSVVKQEAGVWKIMPLTSGETEIIFSCGDVYLTIAVSCNLMELPCQGLTIDGPDSYLFTATSNPLAVRLIMTPENTTDPITWTYDTAIVSVHQEGDAWIITPLASGSTQVIASCGAYSAAIQVEVDLDSVIVVTNYFLYTQFGILTTPYDVSIKVEEKLTFSLRDSEGKKVAGDVSFAIEDSSIATVDENGTVAGVSKGTTHLYVTYQGIVYECIIRVR